MVKYWSSGIDMILRGKDVLGHKPFVVGLSVHVMTTRGE
jgi:hypothetical protein